MRSRTIGRVAGAVTLGAMIATPLNVQGGAARRRLSSVVVSGLAATTAASSIARWSAPRVGGAAAAVSGVTALVERIGTGTGVPFGDYAYTGTLRPQLAGVPVIVPLAWFAMAVPARETAHAMLRAARVRSTPATRIVAGAGALTAWDLFLDPQMVGEGYWRWSGRGRYRGIPLSNFLGWFVTGLGVMAILERALPLERSDEVDDRHDPSPDLVGVYATVAAMETLGFAAYFKDRFVALVGGSAMLPPAILAVVGLLRDAGGTR